MIFAILRYIKKYYQRLVHYKKNTNKNIEYWFPDYEEGYQI